MCQASTFSSLYTLPEQSQLTDEKNRIFMQDAQGSNGSFSGQNAFVILVVPAQQGRCIQPVWTLGFAGAAVETGFDLSHHLLPPRTKILRRRRPAEKQTHSGTGIDLNALRTRHAISAAAGNCSIFVLLLLKRTPASSELYFLLFSFIDIFFKISQLVLIIFRSKFAASFLSASVSLWNARVRIT